jgi:hypothetical protein
MFRFKLAPDAGDGGGNATTDSERDPASRPGSDPKALIREHGGASGAVLALLRKVDKLEADNYSLRKERRELKGKIPGDGVRILTVDEAKDLEAYRALGKPDEIGRAVAERDGLRRAEHYRDVAALLGWKSTVFSDLADAKKLRVEIDPNWKGPDGKAAPARTALVVAKGEDGTETRTPLADHVESQWPDYLPALRQQAGPRPGSPPPAGVLPGPPPVAPPPGQALAPAIDRSRYVAF